MNTNMRFIISRLILLRMRNVSDRSRSENTRYFEMKWNANLMQVGYFIDVFLARHVSGTYAHHQEH